MDLIRSAYYSRQLHKVKTTEKYNPTFKVRHESGETNWMDLNEDSARELKWWLELHYGI